MLKRMLNAGQLSAGDVEIHALLAEIAARKDVDPSIRADAEECMSMPRPDASLERTRAG